jgi:O-antigen/teichoic acid export membrane protein
MSLGKSSLLTFAARIGYFLLQGAAALLLARWLGPEGRGIYALTILVPHIAGMIILLGMNTSSAYFISSGKLSAPQAQTVSYTTILTAGTISFLLLYALSPVYARTYPDVSLSLFRRALLTIPFIALYNGILGILQGKNRFLPYNLIFLANPFFFLFFFALFFLGLHRGLNGAITAWQASFFLTAVIGTIFLTRGGLFQPAGWDRFKEMLRYGFRVCLADLLAFLNYRLDVLLIGFFLGSREVGYYSVAVVLAETLWFLATALATTHFPHFSRKPLSEAGQLLRRAFGIVFWITLMMTIILRLIDALLLKIAFGPAFLPALPALHYLYPGVIALSLAKILSSFISARGRPDIPMWVSLAGVLANLLLNLSLIPSYGIMGAALASTLSYSLMFFLEFIWSIRKTGIPVSAFFKFSPLLPEIYARARSLHR